MFGTLGIYFLEKNSYKLNTSLPSNQKYHIDGSGKRSANPKIIKLRTIINKRKNNTQDR